MDAGEITAAWMSDVLGAEVDAVSVAPIGTGLVGMNVRIEVSGGPDVPTSLVAKLPSLDETSRATAIGLRNYEREVKFYDEIASTIDIRVPRCHHSEWDPATHDFVLILEDMAPAEQGDQVAGCTLDQASDAVRELARMHGPRWDDPTLHDVDWLTRRASEDDGAQLQMIYNMVFPSFADTYARHLSVEARELVERFGQRVAEWALGYEGPVTVTHGDYRLDNLLFATPAGGPPVTAVDWQTPGHGAPVPDLSYFVGAGLLPEARRAHERELVDLYAASLAEYGVDVDTGWLWTQYVRGAFAGVVMAVVASQIVGESERSESMFAAMATRHLQHALDLDAESLI
jgi:hypothetical protein